MRPQQAGDVTDTLPLFAVTAPARPSRRAGARRRTDLRPTDEQQAVIDAIRAGEPLVTQARAGTGKTATLVMATEDLPRMRCVYLAYNKPIAADARRKFRGNVECRTIHSLAYAQSPAWMRSRLGMPRQNGRMVAQILGIDRGLVIPEGSFDMPVTARLPAHQLGRLTIEGIRRFCYSSDPEPVEDHVPQQPGLTPLAHVHVARRLVPLLQRAWKDLSHPSGLLRFEHDHYLKHWALSGPRLPFDIVLLDEGQDSNRLTSRLIASQSHAQTVIIGDSAQQLYAWRGARDALDDFPDHRTLYLTRSFRFGHAVAEMGNVFLDILGASPLVQGDPGMDSRLVPDMIAPDAILCSTNAGAMAEVMEQLELGRATYLQGGGDGMRRMAEAAIDLQAGNGTNNPELCAFTSWNEVVDYVEVDPSGSDLRAFVRLVDTRGAHAIIEACDLLVNSHDSGTRQADRGAADVPEGTVVVSTMHRSKGLEWNKVRIGADVAGPRVDPETWTLREPDPTEMMRNYVAATRARRLLEPGVLRDWQQVTAACRRNPSDDLP